jgi:hypothetical protein
MLQIHSGQREKFFTGNGTFFQVFPDITKHEEQDSEADAEDGPQEKFLLLFE